MQRLKPYSPFKCISVMNPVPLTFGFHYAAVKDISGALPEQLHFTVTVIAPSGWALLNVCVVFAVLY